MNKSQFKPNILSMDNLTKVQMHPQYPKPVHTTTSFEKKNIQE